MGKKNLGTFWNLHRRSGPGGLHGRGINELDLGEFVGVSGIPNLPDSDKSRRDAWDFRGGECLLVTVMAAAREGNPPPVVEMEVVGIPLIFRLQQKGLIFKENGG